MIKFLAFENFLLVIEIRESMNRILGVDVVMCSSNLLHYFGLESKLINFSDLAILNTPFGWVGWCCGGVHLNFSNHMFCS